MDLRDGQTIADELVLVELEIPGDRMSHIRDIGTITDVCCSEEIPEVEIISLIEEQIPKYKLRADTLTTFKGYENEDWFIPAPVLKPEDSDLDLTPVQAEETLKYFVLCGNRLSQMTKTYNDIDSVTRLLEEKEKDLELAARIGQSLLNRNKNLEEKNTNIESELAAANENLTQVKHELQLKTELLQIYTNDVDESGSEGSTPTGYRYISVELLQRKIRSLEDENRTLRSEATQLADDTMDCEEKEARLVQDVVKQLSEANLHIKNLTDDIDKKTEDSFRQQEECTYLLAQLVDLQSRVKKLSTENEELSGALQTARETQTELTTELADFKEKYAEIVDLLHDTQEQLKRQCRKGMSSHSALFSSPFMNSGSIASELENSLCSEMSSQDGSTVTQKSSNLNKIFETVKLASQSNLSSNFSSIGSSPAHFPYRQPCSGTATVGATHMLSSTSTLTPYSRASPLPSLPKTSEGTYSSAGIGAPGILPRPGPVFNSLSSGYSGHLSLESAGMSDSDSSLLTDLEDNTYQYPAPSGVPGLPGTPDLETALRRLSPAEVARRRACMQSNFDLGSDGTRTPPNLPYGCRTPDSIMSTGSNRSAFSGFSNYSQWKLPEKLQIVKPIEGSLTLHHWTRLATPHMGGLLEERPGVHTKGGRPIQDMEMDLYTLSDLEEDEESPFLGKSFDTSGTFTYTNCTVMHPEDIADLTTSFQGSQMSLIPPEEPSVPTSHVGTPTGPRPSSNTHSRRGSTCTFSTNLGLAKALNERGWSDSAAASEIGSPDSERAHSPTDTPCNSPDAAVGSPASEDSGHFSGFFETVSWGANLLRRTLSGESPKKFRRQRSLKRRGSSKRPFGVESDAPRVISSMRLTEKVQKLGVQNLIGDSLSPLPLQAPFYGRSRVLSPMAQLTSLKHPHDGYTVTTDAHRESRENELVFPSRGQFGVPGRPGSGDLQGRLGQLAAVGPDGRRTDLGTVGPPPSSQASLNRNHATCQQDLSRVGPDGRRTDLGTVGPPQSTQASLERSYHATCQQEMCRVGPDGRRTDLGTVGPPRYVPRTEVPVSSAGQRLDLGTVGPPLRSGQVRYVGPTNQRIDLESARQHKQPQGLNSLLESNTKTALGNLQHGRVHRTDLGTVGPHKEVVSSQSPSSDSVIGSLGAFLFGRKGGLL